MCNAFLNGMSMHFEKDDGDCVFFQEFTSLAGSYMGFFFVGTLFRIMFLINSLSKKS